MKTDDYVLFGEKQEVLNRKQAFIVTQLGSYLTVCGLIFIGFNALLLVLFTAGDIFILFAGNKILPKIFSSTVTGYNTTGTMIAYTWCRYHFLYCSLYLLLTILFNKLP